MISNEWRVVDYIVESVKWPLSKLSQALYWKWDQIPNNLETNMPIVGPYFYLFENNGVLSDHHLNNMCKMLLDLYFIPLPKGRKRDYVFIFVLLCTTLDLNRRSVCTTQPLNASIACPYPKSKESRPFSRTYYVSWFSSIVFQFHPWWSLWSLSSSRHFRALIESLMATRTSISCTEWN